MEETGDEFRDFVLNESGSLLRAAWMLTGDRALAEDLLQTALARAWPHWARIAREGTPAAYVRTVIVRTYASWSGRRWCGELSSGRMSDQANEGDIFAAADERDGLLRALADLPRRQRAVVVLRYYLDLSEKQAADALGCSVGTIKTQAARGLARLRTARADHQAKESEPQ